MDFLNIYLIMKYFVIFLILIGFTGVTNQVFAEMSYTEFLSFCDESKSWNFDLMSINLRLLSSLCDMNQIGFNEKYWNWVGQDLDWKNFTQNVAYEYAPTIPLFVEKGIPETLVVKSGISGRDSFPPPMFAHISFAYYEGSEVKSFYEMYTVKISGEIINRKDLVQSPLKQTKNGNHLEDIRCKSDLVLVLKKSKEFIACVKPETVSKLFDRDWALNEARIIEPDVNGKTLKIQGIVDRWQTPEGYEFHLIPLPREVTRIAHTGNNTLELFATKDTVSNFISKLDGKLIQVEGNFLMEDGKFKRSFSGLPAISVQNLNVLYEPENFAYSILGGKLLSVTKIPDAHGLNIALEEGSGPGEITITIPRALLDTKIGDDDDKFLVLADGIEIPYTEETSEISRTLVIYFENVTQIIQIMSTFPV